MRRGGCYGRAVLGAWGRQTNLTLMQQNRSLPSCTPLGRTCVLQEVSWRLLQWGPFTLNPVSLAAGAWCQSQVQGNDDDSEEGSGSFPACAGNEAWRCYGE